MALVWQRCQIDTSFMYTPAAFRIADPAECLGLIAAHPFVLLIDRGSLGELSHIPVSVEPSEGPFGTLYGHVARANPHAQAILAGAPQTVVASGPHAYVSPTWFGDPDATVPTWNYLAVHAHGVPEPLTDAEQTLAVLERLSVPYEPVWRPTRVEPRRMPGLLAAIIAFRLPITRMEGKAKLSQNKSAEDQAAIRAALAAVPDRDAQGVAAAMAG
jgi:transcriptional regulator